MLEQAVAYRQESDKLFVLLESLSEADWELRTQFKQWTVNDIMVHLHFFDLAAELTLRDEAAFLDLMARLRAAMASGVSHLVFSSQWLEGLRGGALRERWRSTSLEIADAYGAAEPKRRVKWAGPDMSVRSSISARLMETWAHSQAIFDLLGVERQDGDRIRDIAELGVKTYNWSFSNRGLPVPESKPYVRLEAPSGIAWEWGQPLEHERIEGSAVEFCQVVCQTRNIADTKLRVVGAAARQWMSIAQCFADVPEDPPRPGSRYRQAAR